MLRFKELNDKNLFLYAVKHYRSNKLADADEFNQDLKRFKYIKRLTNRYIENGELAERLILNHLIVVFNAFGIEAGLNILQLKLDDKHWPVIKPILIFLKYITNDHFTNISIDKTEV